MSLCYFVLVKRFSPNDIYKIEARDLGLVLENERLNGIMRQSLNKFLTDHIHAYLEEKTARGCFLEDPKGLELYERKELAPHDLLLPVFVDFELQRGFFARFLPLLSKCSFVISEAFSTIISIAALELTAPSSLFGRILSIASSFTFGVSGLIMYFYSQSGSTMSKIGMKIDKLLGGKTNMKKAKNKTAHDCSASTYIILANLSLSGLLLTNVVVSNISGYQGLEALGRRAREINSVIPDFLFNISKWVLITLGSVSSLSFVGSFFNQFSEDIERYLINNQAQFKKATKEIIEKEMIELESNIDYSEDEDPTSDETQSLLQASI